MIKAVIFDFDGVLCQTETYFLDNRLRYFKSLGLDVTAKILTHLVGGAGPDRERLYDEIFGNQEIYWSVKEQMLSYRNYEVPIKQLRTVGLLTLLNKLKQQNILIGVASNSTNERLHRVLNECEIHEYFDVIVPAIEQKRKPDPYVYLETMRLLDISSNECIVIEDSYIGILAAKRADIKVLALKDRDGLLDQTMADARLDSISEVLDYL